VFNLGFLPYFLVGHPIVTLNPNRPKRNVAEKVPNLDFLNKVLGNSLPVESLFMVEAIIVACSIRTKLVYDEGRPPPCSLGLDAFRQLMLS
jgi:hypothetical protein